MDKNILMEVCQILDSYYRDYFRCSRMSDKSRIETTVRRYLKNLPSELYLELNEGAASGLCEHGFFESDLSRCIRKLKEMTQ